MGGATAADAVPSDGPASEAQVTRLGCRLRSVAGPVFLPIGLVAAPTAVPGCCVRHGDPAVVRKRVTFISRPPLWVYLTLVTGFLITLIIVLVLRKQALAPAWPFCERCRRERSTRFLTGWGILLGYFTLFALVVRFVELDPDGMSTIVMLLGIVVSILLALVLISRGTWTALAGGVVRPDGNSVLFRTPAPAFVAALPPPPGAAPHDPPQHYPPPGSVLPH